MPTSTISPRYLCGRVIVVSVLSLAHLMATGVASARAAASPVASPLPAALRALAGLRSYRSDDTMAQRNGAASQATVVVKRTAGGVAYHATLTQRATANGPTTFGEMVMVGERLCMRTDRHARYVCGADAAMARRQRGDFDAMAGLSAVPAGSTIGRVAPETIGGRTCDGYAFPQGGRDGDSGVVYLYIAHDTRLPCMATLKGGPGKATIVWSHYNDPTLTIPATT